MTSDAETNPLPLLNGALPRPRDTHVYLDCLRNHAASLGAHARDGCGEFMPAGPSSLLCAACGCHRNFHRRLPLPPLSSSDDDGFASSSSDGNLHHHPQPPLPLPPEEEVPAPADMLLALRSGTADAPKKRFRTKFTAEQKERMQELGERLGWKMRRTEEGLIEETCREIGVGKGVFKVWLHNNKHAFIGGSSSRGRKEKDVGNGGRGGGGDGALANGELGLGGCLGGSSSVCS